jgi:spore germination protein KC
MIRLKFISARVRLRCSLLLLLFPLLLTGCWDRREIEERAVVLAISVDLAKPADTALESEVTHLKKVFPTPDHPLIRIAAQIAVPGRIPLGPGEGGGSDTKPVWVLEAVGHTIDDAIMTMQQQVSDQLFYGHLRVIIVSEAVARSGMGNLNDYFRRHPEVRRLAWMAVTKGDAATLMKTAPELERVPALYLLSMFDHAVEMGKYPNEFVGEFWSKMSSLGTEPHLPYLKALKNGNIEISGLAYFKGEQMAGVTKPLEIGSYMGITGEQKGGYSVYVSLPGTNETVMFKSNSRQARRSIAFKGGKPLAKIQISIEGDIIEKSQGIASPLDTSYILEQIQADLQDDAVKSYEGLIKKTQEAGSDIFGFGELIRAKHPGYWNRSIRTKEVWEEQYKKMAAEVTCEINIRRIGMKAK